MKAWDEPTAGHRYVVGADVAEGKEKPSALRLRKPGSANFSEDKPDLSAAIVLDVETGQHVATWHSGQVEVWEFAIALTALGYEYNTAQLVPEVNSIGLAVVERLVKDLDYPNIYRSKIYNQAESDPMGTSYGWKTTVLTRPLIISRIQEYVSQENLFTRDRALISELRTMEYDEQGRPAAQGKNKDDLVMALGIALQARFEMLHGTATEEREKPKDRLDHYTRTIWNKAKEDFERSRNGKQPPDRRYRRRLNRPARRRPRA